MKYLNFYMKILYDLIYKKRIFYQQRNKIAILFLFLSSCNVQKEQKKGILSKVCVLENKVVHCSFLFSIKGKNQISPIPAEFFSFGVLELIKFSSFGDTSNFKIRILGKYKEDLYLIDEMINSNKFEIDSLILNEKNECGKINLFIGSIENNKILFKNKIKSFDLYDLVEINSKFDINNEIIIITRENDDSVLIGYSFKLVEE
ncbi:MAG: hypothetical protein IPF63_11630 [Bacteroidetes bacterium]|nr:hypothetical protein [Bacteroidota bacterium]MBK7638670.1 hypothetical protein [Bacteroidota bacterium]